MLLLGIITTYIVFSTNQGFHKIIIFNFKQNRSNIVASWYLFANSLQRMNLQLAMLWLSHSCSLCMDCSLSWSERAARWYVCATAVAWRSLSTSTRVVWHMSTQPLRKAANAVGAYVLSWFSFLSFLPASQLFTTITTSLCTRAHVFVCRPVCLCVWVLQIESLAVSNVG